MGSPSRVTNQKLCHHTGERKQTKIQCTRTQPNHYILEAANIPFEASPVGIAKHLKVTAGVWLTLVRVLEGWTQTNVNKCSTNTMSLKDLLLKICNI